MPRLLALYPHFTLAPVPNTAAHNQLITARVHLAVSNSTCQPALLSPLILPSFSLPCSSECPPPRHTELFTSEAQASVLQPPTLVNQSPHPADSSLIPFTSVPSYLSLLLLSGFGPLPSLTLKWDHSLCCTLLLPGWSAKEPTWVYHCPAQGPSEPSNGPQNKLQTPCQDL